jgi:hypothetical protein
MLLSIYLQKIARIHNPWFGSSTFWPVKSSTKIENVSITVSQLRPAEKRIMKDTKRAFSLTLKLRVAAVIVIASAVSLLTAQAPSRFVGVIAAINGNTLTIKTHSGQTYQVVVPATAPISRIEPGQRDLRSAATIHLSDLSVGDRALVNLDPSSPGGQLQAAQIVAVKEADVARKQEMEREDWQRNGVGGMVKSVDPATGIILLTSGGGALTKTVTIHTTNATILKRYAPGSEEYAAALPAPITDIHSGDQLRARGTKNADGTVLDAEEVVSGSFRNISGRISSLDEANSTLTVKDLATKKQVTIHIASQTHMRRLPDRMAQILAARLKEGTSSGGQGYAARNGAGGAQQRTSGGERGEGQGEGRNGDLQQILNRAPTIQFSELKKGEAIMLVSTEGTSDVTAITLLAGVEPLLESPDASRNLLSDWSMGNSAGATEATQ